VRLLYEIAIRPIYFFKHEPSIAAVLDVRTTRILERTLADLLADGLSPAGHYVAKRVSKYQDPRIALYSELVGKAQAVTGSTLALVDSKDEIRSVDAHEVWLEKKPSPRACLMHSKVRAKPLPRHWRKQEQISVPGQQSYNESTISLIFFASRQHLLKLGIPFKFSPLLNSTSKGLFPKLEFAAKPPMIFDQTGAKTDTWNDRGLNQYGPYTAKVFTPNRPRLCVVCQKTHKGRVEQFLHKFINGIVLPAPARLQG
jgi:hypothetical protein